MPLATPRLAARDPALAPRIALSLLALALLWPGLRLTEFDPVMLFDAANARPMGKFLAQFFPPTLSGEFLLLVGRATLETLAIANVGIALAFVIAFPLSLATSAVLSPSAIGPARDARLRRALRYPVRLLVILLRGIPELVWALLFVRAVGLGPSAGVLALAITYGGMLAKVYAEIYESSGTRAARAHGIRRRPAADVFLRRAACRATRDGVVHRVPLGMRGARLGDHGVRRRRRAGPAA